MKRLSGIIVLLASCLAAGCTSYMFSTPITISTKSKAVENVRLLGEIKREECNLICIFPMPKDSRVIYDELLEDAKKKGGNALVDCQLRSTDSIFAFFVGNICHELVCQAAIIE